MTPWNSSISSSLTYSKWSIVSQVCGKKNIISGRLVGSPFLWYDIMCWFYVVATSVTSSRSNSIKQNLRQSTWTGSDGPNNSRSTKSWRKCFHQPSRSFLKFDQYAFIFWFIGDETIENECKTLPSFDKSLRRRWISSITECSVPLPVFMIFSIPFKFLLALT